MDDVQGFVLSAAPWIVAILGAGGIAAVIKVVLDYLTKARKQTDDMATTVAELTMSRLKSVERHGIICEANLAHNRHRLNNLSGSFDGMLLLIEMAPEKTQEIVARIKEKRAADAAAEAIERAEILAAAVAAVGDELGAGDLAEKVQ
jgi:hypothetical protein